MTEIMNRRPMGVTYVQGVQIIPDKQYMNAEPGMGDVNVMVKPSSLKDKTPMCLVNELARFNRIQHQYRLTKEEGPPHRKKFTVTLKLGDTEFEAQGTSIKKAQHEAAAIALRKTKYKHPPPKLLPNTRVNTTPTVELNALAMKRGEPTMYTILSQPSATYYQPPYPLNYYSRSIYQKNFQTRAMYNDYCFNEYAAVMSSYSYPGAQFNNVRYKCPAPYKISLKVGNREYLAEGNSPQIARHNAAKKALEDLKTCPDVTAKNGIPPTTIQNTEQPNDETKSPISAVHEKAFRHDLQATFEVVDEKGPPHMRTFVTECKVGDKFKTVGEGNGKKISKRRAAEKMLELLESLPSPHKPSFNNIDKKRIRKRIALNKKKTRIIRENDKPNETQEESEKRAEANPTTRLLEYQKKRHGKEPVYVLVEEKGRGRKKQFSIEVQIDDLKSIGNGTNKKDAKRHASEAMLQLLGLEITPKEKPVKAPETTVNKEEQPIPPTSPKAVVNGKQLAPGLLLVPNANISIKQNGNKNSPPKAANKLTNGTSIYDQTSPEYTNAKHKYFANINIQKDIAKEQLIRLANNFGYEVEFADFPKGRHHQEYLSLVTMNTSPPQTCYGSGDSTESAQNEAAFNALSMVSEMGIENLFIKKISYIPENEIVS